MQQKKTTQNWLKTAPNQKDLWSPSREFALPDAQHGSRLHGSLRRGRRIPKHQAARTALTNCSSFPKQQTKLTLKIFMSQKKATKVTTLSNAFACHPSKGLPPPRYLQAFDSREVQVLAARWAALLLQTASLAVRVLQKLSGLLSFS